MDSNPVSEYRPIVTVIKDHAPGCATFYGAPCDCDGFHTFTELYECRALYNALAFNALKDKFRVIKSLRHNSGEFCFGGDYFIVQAHLPTGQISQHYPLQRWRLFDIPEVEQADEWDQHTATDVQERLEKFLISSSKERD